MSFWRAELLKVIARLKELQPLDADLTSWAGINRAAGFDAFVAAPSSANLAALLTDESGTGAVAFINAGTFTPAFAATGATFSYSLQNGQYARIGNVVYFFIALTLNTSGNTLTANALTITGLPFAANAVTGGDFPIRWANSTTSYVDIAARTSASSTSLILEGNTAAATSNTTALLANGALHATNGSTMRIFGFYFV